MAFDERKVNVELNPETSPPLSLKYIGPVMAGQLLTAGITHLQDIIDRFIIHTVVENTAWLKQTLRNPNAGTPVNAKGRRAHQNGWTHYTPSEFNRNAYNSIVLYTRHHTRPHQRSVIPRRATKRRSFNMFS
jgi:hypothetical protein